ncbi:DUF6191 domain-containing protein [Streptomyces sp. NPDC004232]|uniref:DUF6191 domain-containing protein n=1 Tax=unclassified Streptomyces TaxID=2593676 RepID=UPI001D5C1CF7|nr:hypothetical protein [Streptomyces sp. tea 10]
MNILEEVFLPSARHVQEERQRLEWMRDDEGEGDPYRGPINLDSGIVHIRIGPKAAASAERRRGPDARP